MVFSSITFLMYFLPAFLAVYYVVPREYKNIVILLFSILFYSWGAPKFIFVILGTTLIDFHLVRWMYKTDKTQKKLLLTLSICVNLGLLIYFKYSNFFVDNVNVLLGLANISEIQWVKLVLPIGISFYTFESITYSVDVYRQIHQPLKRFWDYQLYIILFPKLIAGPIVRYHDIAGQITNRERNENLDVFLSGFYRFCIGLAKKVIIANHLVFVADQIIDGNSYQMGMLSGWIGMIAYALQIYFDFSGYSDMAIGLCRMIGFKIPENFDNPYSSSSITEFWRRWHISLGRWMRDYLYIPLGGNRQASPYKLYRNLWIVFVISGLWHGASWSFIIWGMYHGLFIVLERGPLAKLHLYLGKIPSVLLTFFIVMVGWMFFRIPEASKAFVYISKLFTFQVSELPHITGDFVFVFCTGLMFALITLTRFGKRAASFFYSETYTSNGHIAMFSICFVLLILSISSITSYGFNPFIYFRF